jgi:HEAT repeat protein
VPILLQYNSCSSTVLQVAYVLGQLQNKAASDALSGVLKNVDEHPMVRHEAAEALGSIAGTHDLPECCLLLRSMHICFRVP